MKNKKISTKLGIIVIVIFTITASILVWIVEKNQEAAEQMMVSAKKPVITQTPKNSQQVQPAKELSVDISKHFQYSKGIGFYGTLVLTGYLNIKHVICEPKGMCTKTVDYASIVITGTSDNAIYDFMKNNEGNSYVGKNSISLGCYEKDANRIYSINEGDDKKYENIIIGNDLSKLLQSNKNNPVKLQLAKPVFTSGGDTPECYSHFRSFEVLP